MKKNTVPKVLALALSLVLVIGGFIIALNIGKEEESDIPIVVSDAQKFKKEYEDLNNKQLENGDILVNLNILDENPMVYSSTQQIEELLNNNSGIVYLGFPESNASREVVQILLDVAFIYHVDTINYINIKDIRSSVRVDNGKLLLTKGKSTYYKLLELFDEQLEDFNYLYNGKIYITNEKRIFAPTIIFIKDGKVIDSYTINEDNYTKLSDNDKKEITKTFENDIKEMNKTYCDGTC